MAILPEKGKGKLKMKLNILKENRERLLSLPKIDTVKEIRSYLPEKILNIEKAILGKIELTRQAMATNRTIGAGELVRIELKREAKCYQDSGLQGKVIKHSHFTVQAAIEDANKASVKKAYADGTREKKGLPDATIRLSKVLRYNLNTDNVGVTFGTIENPKCERKVEWLLGNRIVDKRVLIDERILQASETRSAPDISPSSILLNPDNIVSIH